MGEARGQYEYEYAPVTAPSPRYLFSPHQPAFLPVPLRPDNVNYNYNYNYNDNDVRTLFIAGLPEDVKPREIYHLFRDFPGYISSNLRPPSGNSQAFAFAVFADQPSAAVAMRALNGTVFDLEKGSTLYIDFAKSNSRSKRHRTDDERTRSPALPRGGVELGLGSLHIPGTDNSHYNMVDYPSAQSHLNVDSRGIYDARAAQSSKTVSSTAPQDTSPCPTIFVANLGPTCSEHELQQIFSRSRGFLKMKFQRAYGAPVAFIDFEDTACSTAALIQLQGTILQSSPAGEGICLEYARSRMGKRRRSSHR